MSKPCNVVTLLARILALYAAISFSDFSTKLSLQSNFTKVMFLILEKKYVFPEIGHLGPK